MINFVKVECSKWCCRMGNLKMDVLSCGGQHTVKVIRNVMSAGWRKEYSCKNSIRESNIEN